MAKKRIPEIHEALTGEEEMDVDDIPEIVTPVAPAVPAQAAPVAAQTGVTLTFEQMKELMGLSGQQAAEMMAKAMEAQSKTNAEAAARVRNPIPEGTDASYPRISALNPLGERDHPRPGLKCDFYLGTREPKSQTVQRTYQFVAEDLTAYEQIALNTLTPTSGAMELLDGAPVKVELVATKDDITDEITRMVLIVPPKIIQKGSEHKNMLPSVCKIVEQLTGKNYAKLSKDDLAWFMAEHRKKNYVAGRESVAA